MPKPEKKQKPAHRPMAKDPRDFARPVGASTSSRGSAP